jgi:hypothetical protein
MRRMNMVFLGSRVQLWNQNTRRLTLLRASCQRQWQQKAATKLATSTRNKLSHQPLTDWYYVCLLLASGRAVLLGNTNRVKGNSDVKPIRARLLVPMWYCGATSRRDAENSHISDKKNPVTSYADAWVQPGYNLGIVWAAELGVQPGVSTTHTFSGGGGDDIGHFEYSLVNVNHSDFILLSWWFESWLYLHHLTAKNEIRVFILRFEHICNVTTPAEWNTFSLRSKLCNSENNKSPWKAQKVCLPPASCLAYSSILTMETVQSSEMSVHGFILKMTLKDRHD